MVFFKFIYLYKIKFTFFPKDSLIYYIDYIYWDRVYLLSTYNFRLYNILPSSKLSSYHSVLNKPRKEVKSLPYLFSFFRKYKKLRLFFKYKYYKNKHKYLSLFNQKSKNFNIFKSINLKNYFYKRYSLFLNINIFKLSRVNSLMKVRKLKFKRFRYLRYYFRINSFRKNLTYYNKNFLQKTSRHLLGNNNLILSNSSFLYYFNLLLFHPNLFFINYNKVITRGSILNHYPNNYYIDNRYNDSEFYRNKRNSFNNNPSSYLLNLLIIQFIENKTNKLVFFKHNKNMFNYVPTFINILLVVWSVKLNRFYIYFKKRFKIYEFLRLVYLSLRYLDIKLFFNLINTNLKLIDFWHHRLYFHFIFYIMRFFFINIFKELRVKGIQIEFKGKISLVGNARKRKASLKLLKVSKSNYNYKTRYLFKPLGTISGALGLKIWFYYV